MNVRLGLTVVYVAWTVTNFIIHGQILMSSYEAPADL